MKRKSENKAISKATRQTNGVLCLLWNYFKVNGFESVRGGVVERRVDLDASPVVPLPVEEGLYVVVQGGGRSGFGRDVCGRWSREYTRQQSAPNLKRLLPKAVGWLLLLCVMLLLLLHHDGAGLLGGREGGLGRGGERKRSLTSVL